MENLFDPLFRDLEKVRSEYAPGVSSKEIGKVKAIYQGVVLVDGLPGTGNEELLKFQGGLYGMAFNLDPDAIGVVLLGEIKNLQVGDKVERTGKVVDIPVGSALLGRVIDPLGFALDNKGLLEQSSRSPVERPSPPITDRAPVSRPLQTGIKVIDAFIPVGRGQRELILGDRQTGKTAIAVNTILNQKDKEVICIYCAIGQQAASVTKTLAVLDAHQAMDYTIVMISQGNDPPGLIYLAPYAATSIGEYFMEMGKDVLIVYDDLTHHARAYREISLLLRRPPGREAFPGDIFYIHARLLERGTQLNNERGGGSLTALPIIETEGQNLAAYIPTNLISITDGQIYLSPKLFEQGMLPAVEVEKSVSRVGDKAQRPAYRGLASPLKLAYIQYKELEVFMRFGTRMDDQTKKYIAHGQRIQEFLFQMEFDPVSLPEQIIILTALSDGLLDKIPLEKLKQTEKILRKAARLLPEDLLDRMNSSETFSEKDRETLAELADMWLKRFYIE
ncbi:alternate F1F0 ATPase, F1 subunit alpha [Echinicola shivajiensis]|uniref:alternate F1F0 ATPase, F1 subunit alpha n=1 Tax=Echinicola shivajiensis TaxID=1035916 RepID=UPI001BFC25D3|nr:alternate F1F0 ATPase, F1 subunit alpha [Echinicola shivajiensis]